MHHPRRTHEVDAVHWRKATVGGYLGVRGADASGSRSGALILAVEDGSPAAEAGLEEDDVITGVDDHAVTSMIDLVAQVTTNRPGDDVTLAVVRGDDTLEVDVVLGRGPSR
mgnify:CR=1 FL=1